MRRLTGWWGAARGARAAWVLLVALAAGPAAAAIDALTLGGRYDGTQSNINFRVFSSRATRVEVWIYKTPSGAQEAVKYVMTKGTGTGFLNDVDGSGNRFNPNKLLLDPYAREVSQDMNTSSCTDGTIYASGASHRNKDSGACAPKGVVLAADGQSTGTKPTRAFKDDVVYEVHVRGL